MLNYQLKQRKIPKRIKIEPHPSINPYSHKNPPRIDDTTAPKLTPDEAKANIVALSLTGVHCANRSAIAENITPYN